MSAQKASADASTTNTSAAASFTCVRVYCVSVLLLLQLLL